MWDSSKLSLFDLSIKFFLIFRCERGMKGTELIDETAQRPDVGRLVVAHLGDLFWAHIIRSTDIRDRH